MNGETLKIHYIQSHIYGASEFITHMSTFAVLLTTPWQIPLSSICRL